MDFRHKGFVKEALKSHRGRGPVPAQITTAQTSDASIYIIGGTRQQGGSQQVVPDTSMVDANMTVYEREPMKTARFNTPLALIRDRFILALGGYSSR